MSTLKPRTFDSMKAASAALRLPLHRLRTAKAAGCPAFRSNRVYEGELLQWLERNPHSRLAVRADAPRLLEELEELERAAGLRPALPPPEPGDDDFGDDA